jgi:hypothetical protein
MLVKVVAIVDDVRSDVLAMAEVLMQTEDAFLSGHMKEHSRPISERPRGRGLPLLCFFRLC